MLPLLPIGLAAGSFLSGLFKNKGKNDPKNRTTTSTTGSTNTSSVTPTLAPQYQSLENAILPSITKRLSNPGGLPAGYLENGIQTVNETYNDAKLGLDNDLTGRGLGTSPVAGSVLGSFNRGRATDIAKFRNSAAEKGRDMENQDLMTALSALNFGRGSTSTSTGTGTGSTTLPEQPGGAISGGFEELIPMLGWLIGTGAFGGEGADGGGGGGGGMGGGNLLAQLFGGGRSRGMTSGNPSSMGY